MVRALFDTNILIDYLGGIPAAKAELARYARPAISVITWMEVMAGVTREDEAMIRAWLTTFDRVALDETVADRAVSIRAQRRIRLPDAIIWASAQVHSMLLVSRNTKDFPPDEPGVRMPYEARR
ncbi:type II toxin-antitoxin system VapC family toxin [Castellaniella sp. GW247-6E4]|uniref:type II toxin-antitoxin system VapC family toxin n=1 Tax=Castellaniella sp. GW247-6E4 TaxID=3140380 RepID=UPI003315A63E